MDNLIIIVKVTRTKESFKSKTTLTQQRLLTTKEKLVIVPIMSFTTTLTQNCMITPYSNCKRITIGNLVKKKKKNELVN